MAETGDDDSCDGGGTGVLDNAGFVRAYLERERAASASRGGGGSGGAPPPCVVVALPALPPPAEDLAEWLDRTEPEFDGLLGALLVEGAKSS